MRKTKMKNKKDNEPLMAYKKYLVSLYNQNNQLKKDNEYMNFVSKNKKN